MSTAIQPLESAKKPYKPKFSRKAPAIQNAVLAKRASGDSKAKISRDLGISPFTVTNVLELNDFDRCLQSEQAQSLSLIPKAIQVAHARLAKGSENMAIHVLENTIWPLQSKTSKPPEPGLTLAIQNLMGNVQVNSTSEVKPSESEPICVSATTPEPSERK